MANLNLSEFTEKLFVADADHTFIWDTQALISKRVSRNSWLNSGTLTSDAPVTISQTWNAVGQTFKALVVNAAGTSGTNSASGSLLLDLQVNTATKFKITKNGMFSHTDTSGNLVGIYSNNNTTYFVASDSPLDKSMGLNHGNSILFLNSSGALAWTNQARGQFNESAYADTILLRDGAGQLALRNGAAAQTFNVYGTYTSASVYERMFMRYSGTDLAFQVGAETLGATARPLQLWTGGASRLHITTAGNVGIGTTAPGAKLEIVESTSNVAGLVLRTTTVGSPRFEFIDGATTPNKWSFGCGAASAIDGKFFIYDARQLVHRFAIDTAGNVGIGTTSPTSKLQVTNGDVEIETVTSGIIMKAAGTANRYRITLNAGGTDFVITAL